jgi:hypothetical protein
MENPERDHQDDLSIHEVIKLKWILKKWDGRAWTGLIWLRTETKDGLL